jgi:hypothetical protein
MLRLRFHRRMLLALAGAVVLAAVGTTVGLALSDREASSSWELPAHDLAATRHGGRIAGTKVNWHVDMKGGVAGAPAIVDGTVCAASIGGRSRRSPWRPGELTGGVRLPLLSTAAARASAGSASSIAVGTYRLVAASDRVIALDRRTGRTLWTTKPLRTSTSEDYFWGPPVIAGDLVLVGSGSGAELPTARGRQSAYSLSDGSLVWSTPTVPPGANGGGVIAPASVDLRTKLASVATGSPYRALPGRNPNTDSLLALQLGNGAISGRTRSTRATSMDSTSTVRR